jgi:hypothetical protein
MNFVKERMSECVCGELEFANVWSDHVIEMRRKYFSTLTDFLMILR